MASLSAIARLQANRGTLPWRKAACLLLAVFFLYNPFVTISMASGPFEVVRHPVSYRSTIASSELGCGTVQHNKLGVASLKVLVAIEKVHLQEKDDIRPMPTDDAVRAVTQEFATSLWFRPPPVR